MKPSRATSLLALVVFIAALGGYVALRSLVSSTNAKVIEINKEVEAKNAEAAHLTSVRDRLAELAGVEQGVHAYFVPDTAVVTFINELQSRGSLVGATVEISSVAASAVDKTGHSTLKIALTISGPFDAVVRALGSIEYAPYDITLTNLSLIADPATHTWTASAGFAVGSVKGDTPALPPPTSAVSASTTPLVATTSPSKKQP